ncbi:MAG: hypothetical protein LBL00_05280 [Endomicrobium sp.]|jgi:hypothetical protein|nr:hypothetical protein [Endomicrobium sp.]
MVKKVFLVLVAVIFASCSVYATALIKIARITNSIQIKTPDGEISVYKNIESIPELVYGSKIHATGGTAEIRIFNTASITLEKNQEILILKHPVSKEIEVSKVESKVKNSTIKAWLAGYALVTFGSDTRVTFLEKYPSIIFRVRRGEATVKGREGKYVLKSGEYYEAKQNMLR